MEFSSTHLVGTKRNDNFYFPYFSSFSDLFWLEMNHNRISFFFFVEFFTIFMEFYITHRVGTEQNGSIIFVSLFLIFFQPILAWNEFLMVFFNFLNYFAIFWGILCYVSDRNVTDVLFLFSLFLILLQSILVWNESTMVFFSFLIFFWNFLLRVWMERNETKIFIFNISHPLLTYFGLKWTIIVFLFFLLNFILFLLNFLLRIG